MPYVNRSSFELIAFYYEMFEKTVIVKQSLHSGLKPPAVGAAALLKIIYNVTL